MAVNHIVYFKFKEDAKKDEIKKHMDMFEALSTSVPGVISYSAGETFSVSYEETGDYDVMHCLKYDTEQQLENYFFNPEHKAFIEQNKSIWQDVLVVNAQI